RFVERFAFAAIAGNHCRVARLGVCQRQRPAAEAAVVEKSLKIVESYVALQLCKLTNVVLFSVNLPPTQKDVGRTLCEALPKYDPAAVVVEGQFDLGIWFKHGRLRFLNLKKKRIVTVDALQQEHPTPGANTSDANHFAREVHDLITRHQHLAI